MYDADRMDEFSFEVLAATLWSKLGYQTFVTPIRRGDGGIDVAAHGKAGLLIQRKSSSRDDVGWDAVKEVIAGAAKYRARFAGTAFSNVATTNQGFNKGARSQAEANKVTLIEREELEEVIAKHPIRNHEFDEALIHSLPVMEQSG